MEEDTASRAVIRINSAPAVGHDRGDGPAGSHLRSWPFDTDQAGYQGMLAAARASPERVWAVDGCNGIGRNVAVRLADGEQVIDVPPKLFARVRTVATGQGH